MENRGEAPATFLLERDAELGGLERAIGAAAGGAGGLVAVEGEAGIGKSRLLAAGRELAEAAGLRVLAARGSEFERAHGYGIVRQLLEPPLARADAAARGALLAGPARAAGGLLGEAGAPELGPDCEDAAFASLHALYWLTVNLAEREPLALVVDDAQWADAISLRWLGYLARRIEGLPAVILVAVRTGAPLEVELADLLAAPDQVLRPRRLSADAGRALARELTGAEVAPEFSAAVHEATGGNPLLLRELVSALAEEGVAPDAAGARRAREVAPEAVTRAVSLRLARLPERVQSVAVAVAVLGDNAGAGCVAHFTGLEREEAARAVAELAAAGILRPGWPAGFAHPVLGAAVYERLSEPERQRLHARAAEVLELVGAPEHAVAAQQLRTPPAGRAEAVAVLRRAAERARAAGDPEEALTYLRRALQEPPAPEALPELLVELGECERRAGAPEALDRLRRAHELLEDPDRRAHVAYVIGRSLMWSGRNADAVPWIERAIADLPAGDPARARRYEAELISAMLREPATRRDATRRLAAIAYDSLATDVGTRMLLACRAWVATSRGEDLAFAVGYADRVLDGATVLHADDSWAYWSAAYVRVFADDLDGASRASDAALDRARATGDPAGFARASWFCGYIELMRGALADSEAHLRSSLDVLGETEVIYKPWAQGMLAQVLVERGELDEAEAILARHGDALASPLWRARAELRLRRGDAEGALADAQRHAEEQAALETANPAMSGWRPQAVEALLALGRGDEAQRLAVEEVDLARAWGAARPLGAALRAAGLAEGGQIGLVLLEEAARVLDESPSLLERAKALTDLGAALRRANRRAASREPLRRALDLAQRCGAAPLAARAHEELLAAGARPRRLVLSGADSLTASEQRVARMAAGGMSNRDIAQSLFVTPRTIEMHLSNVFRKLDISSRTQIADKLEPEAEAA